MLKNSLPEDLSAEGISAQETTKKSWTYLCRHKYRPINDLSFSFGFKADILSICIWAADQTNIRPPNYLNSAACVDFDYRKKQMLRGFFGVEVTDNLFKRFCYG